MRVHIEDDGLIAGSLDDGPEGVFVNLRDLTHIDSGAYSVQARLHRRGPGPLPLTGCYTTEAHCHILPLRRREEAA